MSKSGSNQRGPGGDPEPEVDLAEVFALLLRSWKLIAGAAFGGATIAALVSLFWLTPQFESKATLMSTPEYPSKAALRSLSGSLPFGGIFNLGGAGQEMHRYMEILQSRALLSKIIDRQDLSGVFLDDSEAVEPSALARERLIRALSRSTSIALTTQGVLTIAFRHPDPAVALMIVEEYLKALQGAILTGVTTQARSTELFISDRLHEANEELTRVERAYVELQRTQGVVQLSSQAGLSLNTVANLRAQLIEKEMEIELYRDVLRDSGELRRLESERRQIQSQMDRLIQTSGPARQSGKAVDVFTPLEDVPNLEMAFATAQREYMTQVKLVELLTQQYEMARIESKRSEPMFQVLDPPVLGVIQVAPNKKLNTILGFMGGLVLGLFVVGLKGLVRVFRANSVLRRVSVVSSVLAQENSGLSTPPKSRGTG